MFGNYQMKTTRSVLVLSILLVLGMTSVRAEFIGFKIGASYWEPELTGSFIGNGVADTPINLVAEDVQATLVELTVRTIATGIGQLASTTVECFVCGGGVHNHYLVNRLQMALPDTQILNTDQLGLDPDYVEAVAFAWLARQSMNHQTGNLPTVTQASSETLLGGIYFQQ